VDVIELERGARSEDPDQLFACLELYRGELLEGLIPREPGYDEWLLPTRRRLQLVACQIADRLAALLAGQDRIDEAIEALNRRLTMDPACELAHRLLMEMLVRSGRRSDALRQYQICAEALGRELGAEPTPETKALYANLQKAESRTEPVQAPSPVRRTLPTQEDRPTVAVLPFENLSGTADSYFVDGIVEDIITSLSCFHSLLVIARGASFAYRDRDVPEKRIAAELGALYLVRGSVQRAGRRVRVNVQLLDAPAERHVWAHRFDREMEDVFLVQDEITSTVVATLAGRVEAARLDRARRAPAERLEAYDFFLRGKDHHHRYTPDDCRACIDFFGRAIERDPNYAVAYAWLACGLGQAMNFQLDEQDKLVERAQMAAEQGLELDENESECHRILAQVFLTKRDLKRSLWHQERALFLNPNDDRSVCAMGEILGFVGRFEEAAGWVEKAMRLNPYHPPRYWTHLARALFHLKRYDEALGALEHVRQLRADDLVYGIAASASLQDTDAVERSVAALRETCPDLDPVSFAESLPYVLDDDRRAVLEPLRRAWSNPEGGPHRTATVTPPRRAPAPLDDGTTPRRRSRRRR
jgi:TolB-like protein